MGAYKYIQKAIRNARKERNETYRARLALWRKEESIVRTDVPYNLPSARKIGYRATKGFVVARVRTKKGMRKRPKPSGGRSSRHNYRYTPPSASHQSMAERRANRKYINCEVLGSYLLGEDGQYKYFEIVLADRDKNSSKSLSTKRKGKAFRGLTSTGRKGRKRLKTRKKSKKKNKRGKRKKRMRPQKKAYVKSAKKVEKKEVKGKSRKKTTKKSTKKTEKK